MKKHVLFAASLVLAVGIGSAAAGDQADKQPYNGITYFDRVPVATQAGSSEAGRESRMMTLNGITFFGASETKQASGQAAGGQASTGELAKKPYNGITVF